MKIKQQVVLDNFGTLHLFSTKQGYYWFGRVKNIAPDYDCVELTINIDHKDQPLTKQKELIKQFADNYSKIMTILYDHMRSSFAKIGNTKTIEDLKNLYFLSSVELKKDNEDWWIVFEPKHGADSSYNFLPRFTLNNMKVKWSNMI